MPMKIRSRSSDSYIEKLPRDNSSKSLIASIEDVSRNLKYANTDSNNSLKMPEASETNVDELIADIIKRVAVQDKLSKNTDAKNEKKEKLSKKVRSSVKSKDRQIENIYSKVISSQAEKGDTVTDIDSDLPALIIKDKSEVITEVIDVQLPEEIEETEIDFIVRTINELVSEDAKLGTYTSEQSKYFYRGRLIHPKAKPNKQVSFSERVASEKSDYEKNAKLLSDRVRAVSSTEAELGEVTSTDVKMRDDDLHYSRVDETDDYIEFMKEISTNTYKPNDFVQVQWDDELLTLNAKIYNSIREKKVVLDKRKIEDLDKKKGKFISELIFTDLESQKLKEKVDSQSMKSSNDKDEIKYTPVLMSELINTDSKVVKQNEPEIKNPFKKMLMKIKKKKKPSPASNGAKKLPKFCSKIFKKKK